MTAATGTFPVLRINQREKTMSLTQQENKSRSSQRRSDNLRMRDVGVLMFVLVFGESPQETDRIEGEIH